MRRIAAFAAVFVAVPAFARLALAEVVGGDVRELGQYGVLGAFALMLLAYARASLKREQDRGDRLEEENRRLNVSIQEKIVPAVTQATQALVGAQQVMQAIQYQHELANPPRRRPTQP